MPCPVCKNLMVELEDKSACIKCAKLKVLDSVTASMISCKQTQIFKKRWKSELCKIHRSSLITHIVRHRECLVRKFFQQYSSLDLDQVLSDTLFLRRAIQESKPNGSIIINSIENSELLLEVFKQTKKKETDFELIQSCYALMLYQNEFVFEKLSEKDILENFIVVHTEDFQKLMLSYENYGLYTKEKAEQKIKEYKIKYNKIMQKKIPYIHLTPKQFIKKNYWTINALYVSLLRNSIYSEVFDLRNLVELTNDPSRIMEFVNKFEYMPNDLTSVDLDEFLKEGRRFFKKHPNTLQKLLIFDEKNYDIFPLFVKIKDGKDIVFVSQAFTALMYILLHAVIIKDLFDDETAKLGKLFEGNVKEKFEKLGYTYLPNVKDDPKKPNLEIDGIAIKNDYCFVIESKKRRLPPVVESTEAKKIMIDDLRGIIDGYKRTIKNGQPKIKTIPSLLEKIDHVKNNLKNLGLTYVSKDKVRGLIVTHDYPILSNYKGIKIIRLSDISNEKLEI